MMQISRYITSQRSFEFSELIATINKPVSVDLSFATWCITLLEKAMKKMGALWS